MNFLEAMTYIEQVSNDTDTVRYWPRLLEAVSTLRAALLQSQEALQKIAERGRHGYWLDEDGPDVIAKAVLLSPPVAPKEQ